MDLASVLAELKAVDDFKQPDRNLATASFCQRACKVLEKVVKQAGVVQFDHLVIGIWIVIGSVNELLSQLVDGCFLTELVEKLFRHCARIVLDIKWQQLDEDEKCRQNFQSSLSACHQQMAPRGFTRFGVLQELMENPWTDPVLTMVMGNEEDNEDGEGLAYIQAQDPEILKLRVELMQQENCDEFALNLCTWCLKHQALAGDLALRKTQLVLLHRLSYSDKLQEVCQTIGLEDSISLIKNLQETEDQKELCTILAQTFLVQNWIKPSDNQGKKELLRLWIKLQYQADRDQDRFIGSLWAVAKVSRSTEQLLLIIDAVREQCGDNFLQFYTDLCVFAINVDKGCWEKLKGTATAGPNEEILARKRDMAQVCDKLAHIVSHVSPKIAFCCALTAFTMLPTEQSLQAVREAYQCKSEAGSSSKSQCCSNCASDQGQCLKNDGDDRESRDLNVATLYEVERLCGMLRPAYLSVDSDFSILFSLCRQYLLKENGEAVKSALVRRKSAPVVHGPSTEPSTAQNPLSPSTGHVKPNILKGQAPVKTVDAAAHVSNLGSSDVSYRSIGAHGTVLSPGSSAIRTGQPMVKMEPSEVGQQPGRSGGTLLNQHQQLNQKNEQTQLNPNTQQVNQNTVHQHSSQSAVQQQSNQTAVQQLVLQQLSGDMVQALLHLIHSGQISPVTLNQIMSKNPNVSLQVLQNLVAQARQQAHKTSASTKTQPQQGQQGQQTQQHQIHQQQIQQQPPQKQVQPQVQQLQQQPAQRAQQIQLPQTGHHTDIGQRQLQLKHHQKEAQQQRPSQPSYGISQAAQTSSMQQTGLAAQHHQTGIRQVTSQQVLSSQPSVTQLSVQQRVQGSRVVMQQPQPASSNPQQHHPSVQQSQQQILQGVPQIRPVLPAVSTLRLSGTGEIHVTQPVHVMTFRHSTPIQSPSPGVHNPRLLIQTTSQMLTHLSGGSVVSVQQQPQMLQLPSSTVTLGSRVASTISSQTTPKLIPKAPGPVFTTHQGGRGSSAMSNQTQVSNSGGNRNYSINNLLFTGEQQNNALSITLPDQLPEISVDTISDTLRALSDQPSSGGQAMSKGQVHASHVPVNQTGSLGGVIPVSSVQTPVNTSQSIQQQPAGSMSKQQPKKSTKKPAPKKGSVSQAEVFISTASSVKQSLSPAVSIASQVKSEPNIQAIGQPLPSFSSLFAPNQRPAPAPTSSSTPAASITPTPTSPTKKGPGGQGKGQGKVQKKPVGEKPPNKGKDKGDLMRLLKEVMTIKIEDMKIEESGCGGEATYLHTHGQPASSCTCSPLRSAVQSRGVTGGLSSSIARPHFQQSSQPGLVSVSSTPHAKPLGMVSQQPGVNYPVPVSVSNQSAMSVASHVPSVASTSTVPAAPNSTSVAPYSQPFTSFSRASYSIPSQHNVVSPSVQNSVLTTSASHLLNSPAPISHAVSFPTGQIGTPAVCYSPTTQLPGFLNVVPASVVETSPLKSYSRQDHSKLVRKDSSEDQVVSVPIPASILPEGGIMETGRDGDQSVATYRCIICAKAFMTLDALRLHVKQICKPGFNQPPNLGNRMAFDKAQAMEEGLETSTVFQCMRCFELCISEAGIREHKQVCSKAPKPKTKPKSKTKPKPPKSEAEQATEAKVLELLNKCLGENREKLLEEERNAQLAKQAAGAKKRAPKKRPSTDGDSVASAEGDTVQKPKKAKKEKAGGSVVASSNNLPQNAAAGGLLDIMVTAAPQKKEAAAMTTFPEPVAVGTPPPVLSVTPSHTSPASVPVQSEIMPTTPGDVSVEVKPKPKRKYYPKKKKPAEGADQSVAQPETGIQTEQSDAIDKGKKQGSDDATEKGKKPGTGDPKPVKQKKAKKEPNPPARYKELSSSGGQSFFKCLNCGQTLCSIENFNDHWVECIVMKPLPAKPKCLPKEKKAKAKSSSSSKSDTTTYSSVESIETTIDRVASASFVLDSNETETFSESNLKDVDIPGSDQLGSAADIKGGEKSPQPLVESGEAGQQCIEEKSEQLSEQSSEESSVQLSVNVHEGSEIVSELTVVQEAPVVFEADAGEVINEMQVETTDECASSMPLIKPSLVILEKVKLVDKVSDSCTSASNVDVEGTFELTPVEKSGQDPLKTSPSVSPIKSTSRRGPAQVRKFNSKSRRKPKLRSGDPSKRRESTVKTDSSSILTRSSGSPQGVGDSKYCSLCKRHFNRRVLLIQHLASRHLQPYTLKKLGDTSSYFCHLCQKTFPQFSGYMAHVNSHSQAIVKQFSEYLNKLGSPGRSRRIASQKGTASQNQKKHGRTSPKDLSKAEIQEQTSESEKKKGRSHPRLRKLSLVSNPVLAEKVRLTPSVIKHRRSSVRAAQKQALSKIFISSLGITSSAEPLKENNKRKVSTEEKDTTTAKPKRTRADKSRKDEMESDEDEENAEESRGEAGKEDEPSAAEAVTGTAAAATTTSQGAQAAEKASMDTSTAQSLSHPGPGKPSLSVQCPQNGGSSVNTSQLPSPLSSIPKKPSFLDSFLSFVSSRSPEAPLPINQSKRRISNMGNLDTQSPAVTPARRSSCDTPPGFLGQAALQPPTTSQSLSSVEPSSAVVETASASDTKFTQGTSSVDVTSRRTSSDFDNVYYYGKFEEQLTKQCKVNLGDRVTAKPPEDLAINVKQCTVNLGPKISPQSMMTSSVIKSIAAEKGKNSNVDENEDDKTTNFKPVGFDVSGDSSVSQKEGTTEAEDSPVLSVTDSASQNLPLFCQSSSSLFTGDVSRAGGVCPEANFSVLPMSQVAADVAASVSSNTFHVAEQNPAYTVTSPSPSLVTAVVSSGLSSLHPPPAPPTMCSGEGIVQSTVTLQPEDSVTSALAAHNLPVTTPTEELHCKGTNYAYLGSVQETRGNDKVTDKTKTGSTLPTSDLESKIGRSDTQVDDNFPDNRSVGKSNTNLCAATVQNLINESTDEVPLNKSSSQLSSCRSPSPSTKGGHASESADPDQSLFNLKDPALVQEDSHTGTESVISEQQACKPCSAVPLTQIAETATKPDVVGDIKVALDITPAVNSDSIQRITPVGVYSVKCESDHPPVADGATKKTETTESAVSHVEQLETVSSVLSMFSVKQSDSSSCNEKKHQSLENQEYDSSFDLFPVVQGQRDLVQQKPQQLESNLDAPKLFSSFQAETSTRKHIVDCQHEHTVSFGNEGERHIATEMDLRKMKQTSEPCESILLDQKEEEHLKETSLAVSSTTSDSLTSTHTDSAMKQDLGSMSMMEFLRKSAFTVPEPSSACGGISSDQVGNSDTGNDNASLSCAEEQHNALVVSVKEHSDSLDSSVEHQVTPADSVSEHHITFDSDPGPGGSSLDSVVEHQGASPDSFVQDVTSDNSGVEFKVASAESHCDSCTGSLLEHSDGPFNSAVEHLDPSQNSSTGQSDGIFNSAAKLSGTSFNSAEKNSNMTLGCREEHNAPSGFAPEQHNAPVDSSLSYTVKVHHTPPGSGVDHHDGYDCSDRVEKGSKTQPGVDVFIHSAEQSETEQDAECCVGADSGDIESDDWDTSEDRVKILAFSDENQAVTSYRVVSVSAGENLLGEPENTTGSSTEEHNSSEVCSVDNVNDDDSCENFLSTSVLEPELQLAATPVSLIGENTIRLSDERVDFSPQSVHDQTHQAAERLLEYEEHLKDSLHVDDELKATKCREEQGIVKCGERCENDLQESSNELHRKPLDYPPTVLQKPADLSCHNQDSKGREADSDKTEQVSSYCAPLETKSVADKMEEASTCEVMVTKSDPHLVQSGCDDSVAADECSVMNNVVQKKSAEPDDSDDLPELCIVPDPEVIVIRKNFEQKLEKKRPPTPSDDVRTVISAVIESHEVKIKNLRARSKKTSLTRDTFFARVETKHVVEDTGEEAGPVEPPTRKPLLGVKPLRRVHKPEPFVWEADGEEDRKKLARNERSLKAFRQKAQVGPFTWDSDAIDQEMKDGGREVLAKAAGFKHGDQSLQVTRQPDQSVLSTCSIEDAGKYGRSGTVSDSKVSANKFDYNKVDNYDKRTSFEADLSSTSRKDSSSVTDTLKTEHSKRSKSITIDENPFLKSVQSDPSAPLAVSLRSKVTPETVKTPSALGSEAKKKEVVVSSASVTEVGNTSKNVNSTTESARMTHRSRCTQRQGSFDKGFPATPIRSASRNRKTVFTTKEKRATFRKSRSCDTEGSDVVSELSSSPLKSVGQQRIMVTSMLSESDRQKKVESDSVSKHLFETSTDKNPESRREKAVNSELVSSQSAVNNQLSHTDVTTTLRKWRSRRSLPSSPVKEMEISNTSISKNVPLRPKIKRVLNSFGLKTEAGTAEVEENVNKPKQDLCMEGTRPKAQDDGSIGTRSRHNSKNSKQQSKTAVDGNTVSKALRSRDTTPDISENQQVIDSSKSLRSHDPSISRNSDAASGGTSQDSARAYRRRIAGNSSLTPATKTLRGSGGNNSNVAVKQAVERKPPQASSSRESTPVSSVFATFSQVQTSSSPRLQRNREPRVGQLVSGRNPDQGVSTPQPRKQDAGLKSSPTVSSLTSDQLVASTSSSVASDNAEVMQTSGCLAPKESLSGLKPTYLGAMVRRRQPPTSWRTSSITNQAKKPRVSPSKALQYEIFRVEPMQADSPSDQRRTRSSDRDVEPPPRTVHTRVSVNELKSAVPSTDTGKAGTDQKWSINRHITPAHMKRNSDPHFPFSFQRARRRTQKK